MKSQIELTPQEESAALWRARINPAGPWDAKTSQRAAAVLNRARGRKEHTTQAQRARADRSTYAMA
jgi:hypothetical protein